MTSARSCFYLRTAMFTGFAGIWKIKPFINFYVMLELCTQLHNDIFLVLRGNLQAFKKKKLDENV